MGTVLGIGALAHGFVADEQSHLAAAARLGLVGLEQHLHADVAGGQLLRCDLLVGLDAEQGVGVSQQAILADPEREAPDEVGVGDDHSFGAALGNT